MISVFRGLGSPYLPTIKEVEMSNTGITWLHLSDWHEGAEKKLKLGNTYDRDQVRNRLMDDIKKQKRDNPDLNHIDFIIFSGDIAFSGTQGEYQKAEKFFREVLFAAGFDPNNQEDRKRLFIVPGNHDLERGKFGMLPQDLPKRFTDRDQVPDWLNDEEKRGELLKPFANYKDFATKWTNQKEPDCGYISRLNCEQSGKEVVLLGINSALMAGRTIDGNIDDYGKLIVGEPQITTLLEEVNGQPKENELRIAVLHHPFEWLAEFDRSSVRNLLIENCHFILCGHQHEQKIYQIQGLEGNYIMIPAGASYENREYHNSYNFVHLDFENQQGKIYLRRWIDDKWKRDDATYNNGEYTFRIPGVGQRREDDPQFLRKLAEKYRELKDWKEQHKNWQALCTDVIGLASNPPKFGERTSNSLQASSDFWEFRQSWKNCKKTVKILSHGFKAFFQKTISSNAQQNHEESIQIREEYTGIALQLVSQVAKIAKTVTDINLRYAPIIKSINRDKKNRDKINRLLQRSPDINNRSTNNLSSQKVETNSLVHRTGNKSDYLN
jgi:predicted phosphodiesterase